MGLGTEEEQGYRTGPPGYVGWRNSFLAHSSALLRQEAESCHCYRRCALINYIYSCCMGTASVGKNIFTVLLLLLTCYIYNYASIVIPCFGNSILVLSLVLQHIYCISSYFFRILTEISIIFYWKFFYISVESKDLRLYLLKNSSLFLKIQ